MFNRLSYKYNGKQAFKRNYWKCVAAALIIALLCDGMLTLVFSVDNVGKYVPSAIKIGSVSYEGGVHKYDTAEYSMGTLRITSKLPELTLTLLGIFVFSVIDIGGRRFFLDNSRGEARLGTLFGGFSDGRYMHYVGVMFIIRLKVFLWSLLLVIPGIVKSYEYVMVPYIVAENPEMDSKSAFELSRRMMTGKK